jgi:hypothetical protein
MQRLQLCRSNAVFAGVVGATFLIFAAGCATPADQILVPSERRNSYDSDALSMPQIMSYSSIYDPSNGQTVSMAVGYNLDIADYGTPAAHNYIARAIASTAVEGAEAPQLWTAKAWITLRDGAGLVLVQNVCSKSASCATPASGPVICHNSRRIDTSHQIVYGTASFQPESHAKAAVC